VRRDQRLRREREFAAVYRQGRSWSNQMLALRVLPSTLPQSRFGFAVGKRVGKAVVRNKVKRRLREAVRALQPVNGWDVVIVARPPAAEADFAGLRGALGSLFRRAGLLAPGRPSDGDASQGEYRAERSNP
jgi:ribonuclease P protein component